jgi:hypothetical protein
MLPGDLLGRGPAWLGVPHRAFQGEMKGLPPSVITFSGAAYGMMGLLGLRTDTYIRTSFLIFIIISNILTTIAINAFCPSLASPYPVSVRFRVQSRLLCLLCLPTRPARVPLPGPGNGNRTESCALHLSDDPEDYRYISERGGVCCRRSVICRVERPGET